MNEQKSDRLPQSCLSVCEEDRTGKRRRGEILDNAILQAAWDELSDVGYTHLTMEGVAARAKTNKAVVYRRWANKSELVAAAMRKFLPKFLTPNPIEDVPDTGDLRNDILSLLLGIALPLHTIGSETIHGLMGDHFGKNILASLPQILRTKDSNNVITAIMTILKHAEQRGEISLDKISPRIVSLPFELLRYEVLSTHEPISDKVISEIVDDIFLPLIRR